MTTAVQSDAECLRAFVQRRDESAFRQLVERHGRIVYSAARRQARDAQSAEDITQAVFILLIRKAAAITPERLPGWLVKTTFLVARNALREQMRRARRESIAAGTRPIMSEPAADSDWMKMSPLLDEALCRLSAKDRDLICLRFLQEKTIGEVAAVLGTTESTAGKRIERAIARLRQDFAAHGVAVAGASLAAALSTQASLGCPPGLLEGIASKAFIASHAAAATTTASVLAKGIIIMATAKKTALAAAIILFLLVGGSAVFVLKSTIWNSESSPAAETQQPASLAAAASDGSVAPADRIKVGIYLSDYTAHGPHWIPSDYGWIDQLEALHGLRDPSIELIPVVEPETASNPDLARILSANFPREAPVDGSSVQDLKKLDVIVSQAAHNVPWEVQQAMLQAVHDGVGFLNRGFMTVTPGYTPLYASLSGVDDVVYGWSNNYRQLKCEVVGNHPLLGDLAGQTGKTMLIELAGPIGVARGIPLIRVNDMEDVTGHRGIKPAPGQSMYPFLLSQYGHGRTMVFAFAHYNIPTLLNKANHGRFYIHCVQWLAGRPLN
ncbi:MAG TPA: sigma-70 family RNA polymerase sigma factor [Tepidisphaeraceae bacterium]|jgi:RNA polymerase sigma factor (sigma-70 family)